MIRVVAAGILVLALGLPSGAAAWKRTPVPQSGTCLFWGQRTVPWTLSAEGARRIPFEVVRSIVRDSFGTWEDVGCSDLAFEEQPPSDSRSIGWKRDEPPDNLVLFRSRRCGEVKPPHDPCSPEVCANTYDCWAFGDGVIAVTTTSYNLSTGELIDADIELNGATFVFTTVEGDPCVPPDFERCVATDLQNTVTHEIGHLVGLDHSEVETATMHASAPPGETSKRRLDPDDIQAVCTIYPAGEPVLTCLADFTLRPVGYDDGCSCGAAGGPAGLALAALAALRWLRRRPG